MSFDIDDHLIAPVWMVIDHRHDTNDPPNQQHLPGVCGHTDGNTAFRLPTTWEATNLQKCVDCRFPPDWWLEDHGLLEIAGRGHMKGRIRRR